MERFGVNVRKHGTAPGAAILAGDRGGGSRLDPMGVR